jgi:hypothetical protein
MGIISISNNLATMARAFPRNFLNNRSMSIFHQDVERQLLLPVGDN